MTANGNGEANTITLAAGTYILTAVDNTTDGPNGLPSITGDITIIGDSAATTLVGRPNLPSFGEPFLRIFHVGPTGTLALEQLTVTGGSLAESSWDGAGIFNASGTLTITQSVVTQNYGGLNNTGVGIASDNGTVNITASAIVGNLAEGACGGLLSTNGTVGITHSTIRDNEADFDGGLCNEEGTMSILDTAVVNNGATATGGIANFGTLTIRNSAIAKNGADLSGGDAITNGGMLTVINSTISGNAAGGTANNPGGIATSAGTVQLQNTILAGNAVSLGTSGPDCSGVIISLGNNLIGDPADCSITLLPSDLTGGPGLDAFADNGTPGNGHFPLLPDSPTIDAGNDAACSSTDQLGQPRVGPCDIGAIEFQPPPPPRCLGLGSSTLRGRVNRAADASRTAHVTLTLSGPGGCRDTTLTNAGGMYAFTTLADGTYTVTPSHEGCSFTPATRTVTIAGHKARAWFKSTCQVDS